jgi:hypothetical protein
VERVTQDTALRFFAVGYLALDVLHAADHFRQSRSLAAVVVTLGLLNIAAAIVVAALAVRRHPVAPLAAAAFGTAAFIGLLAVHVAPTWSAVSDSYIPLHLDAISWVSVAALLVAAAGMALSGASMLRSQAAQERVAG